MPASSQTVLVNGLGLHVLEWGDRAAPATALITHGFGNDAATWGDVAQRLAEAGLRVIAADLRGFGDSARAPAGSFYFFHYFIADVAGLVRALAPDAPLFVIGHSFGATVAMYYAGTFPDRVAKLALVDGLGPPATATDVAAPLRMRRWIETAYESPPAPQKPMTRDEATARLSRLNPNLDPALVARRVAELAAPDGTVTFKHDPLLTAASPMPFSADEYKAFARAVTAPTLYVSGGPQGFHVPDGEERLACFPRLSRVTIDGGHALHWTRPAELTDALVAFWRG
jgi:pimeloyl-ACP methyl ester carboxylesterase